MGKQTYTEEFKQETVKSSFQTDKTLGTIAQDLGISRSSLSRWRKEYGPDGTPSVNSKVTMAAADPAEIRRLQKALHIAEQEQDILKKALAITSTALSTGFTQAPQYGLCARRKRSYKRTTQSNHTLPVAANILDQDFSTTAPNQK